MTSSDLATPPLTGAFPADWRDVLHHSVVTAPVSERRWPRRAAFGALLAATAVLYLVGLSASGWANQYYAAAAQAGSESWTAWMFGSLDPSN